jgi:protein-L-isoaspartate(D-aspartate) O-methyltransferase
MPIASGQTISQPYMVARMTELLEPRPGLHVLEIGTGSGYQAAVLARIGCSVLSVERHAPLADAARIRLEQLGLAGSITIVVGDGSLGRPAEAPFQAIVVTAAAPAVPNALAAQLSDGGRLVIPIGPRRRQELVLVIRRGDGFERKDCGPCVFVPLVGVSGFTEEAGR